MPWVIALGILSAILSPFIVVCLIASAVLLVLGRIFDPRANKE